MQPVAQTGIFRLLGLTAASMAQLAFAGPPLSIDDPGILDPGKFEIIVAGASASRESGDELLLPIVDVSYGWSPDIQLAFVATRAVTDPDGGERKSDFGPAAAGVKWRFLNQERLQMSLAPFFEFLPRDGAADREVAEDLNAWVLPMQLQYEFTNWRLNTEVGYILEHDAGDAWKFGAAAAYPVNDRVEALVELRHDTDVEFDERETSYLVGIDFSMTESWHLLASAGAALHESGDDDVDLRTFLGLQWFP